MIYKAGKLLCIMVSILFIMTSCSTKIIDSTSRYTEKVFDINVSSSYNHALTQVIMLKDMLTPYLPEDVTVNWIKINTSPEVRDGLVSGDIDLSILFSLSVVTSIENNLPISILSGHIVPRSVVLSKNPEIETVADLPKMSGIYVNSLTTPSAMALYAMGKDEFDDAFRFRDKFTPLESALALPAFEASDDIDCLSTSFPNVLKAVKIPDAHMVVDLTPYMRKYDLGNYYVVNETFYKNNPLLIEAFRKAQQDALDFVTNETEEAARLLAEFYGIDEEPMLEEIKTNSPSLEIVDYDKCADLMFEIGILDKEPKKFADLPNYEDIPKVQ